MSEEINRTSVVLTARLAVDMRNNAPAQVSHDELQFRRELLSRFVEVHGGRLFASGNNISHAEFSTALEAIACASEVVTDVRTRAKDGSGVGIGISLNELRGSGDAMQGVALDISTALAAAAQCNEVVVSGAVKEQAFDRDDLVFRELQQSKNAAKLGVTAFRLESQGDTSSAYEIVRELIRRRVFRAAGAYIIVSWILVQVASIVFPEFDAPRWSMRVLIVLLTVGFPLAVLLAWTIDFTASGFRRTPESRLSRSKGGALRFASVGIATVMSAAVIWWVWTGYLEPTTQRTTRAVVKENPVVAVDVPQKTAGPDDIDWLGDGIANLLRAELAESRHVIVLSQSRWQDIVSNADSDDDVRDVARRLGVDYLFSGNYLASPNGIVFSGSVEDLENKMDIFGIRLDEQNLQDIIASTTRIATGIKQALKIPLQESVSRFAADFAVANMDAYEAYIAGLDYFVDFDYHLAEASFTAALDIAPDFHMARFRLADVMLATGRSTEASRELDAIPADAVLTDRERLIIEGAKFDFVTDRDPARSIEIYRELVEKYPYDLEAGQHLGEAYWLDYNEDAAIAVFRRLADLHGYDPAAWMALGERLLDVGELDDAEHALQRYAEMAPGDQYAAALLGNLAQLRGNFAASIEFFSRSLELRPGFAIAKLGLARSRFLMGERDIAETLWRDLIADEAQAAGFRIDAAFDLAGTLRGQRRFAESIALLRSLEPRIADEGLRHATMLSTIATAQLEMNEPEQARALIDRAIAESPVVPTRHLFARGLLELKLGELQKLGDTIAEIQELALPPEDPDRTEDKAASYLSGLLALQQDALDDAASELSSATTKSGYEYAIYRVGLARYHVSAGNLDAAREAAAAAMRSHDPGDLRLDLEFDRVRAGELHDAILARMAAQTD